MYTKYKSHLHVHRWWNCKVVLFLHIMNYVIHSAFISCPTGTVIQFCKGSCTCKLIRNLLSSTLLPQMQFIQLLLSLVSHGVGCVAAESMTAEKQCIVWLAVTSTHAPLTSLDIRDQGCAACHQPPHLCCWLKYPIWSISQVGWTFPAYEWAPQRLLRQLWLSWTHWSEPKSCS